MLAYHGASATAKDLQGRTPAEVLVDPKCVARRHDVLILRDLLQQWTLVQHSRERNNHLFLCTVAVLLMPVVVLIFEYAPFLVGVMLLSAIQFLLIKQCLPRFPGRRESNYFYVCFFWSCYLLSTVVYFLRCQCM
jgi:hypothetical protein